ncbi:MAG: hypothetical protein H6581_05225 [Bacteroidia bacterium]|nr:hypothetical protein [Bacteroidia bacterium]
MIRFLTFISLLWITIPTGVVTETGHFSINFRGNEVGELEATRKIDGDDLYFSSFTETSFWAIKRITVLYEYNVHFQKGHLQSSEVRILVNGKEHKCTKVTLKGDCYEITEDGETRSSVHYPVDYSTVMLIFTEPSHISNCFSEEDGTLHPVVNLGNHVYDKIHPKGRKNRYYYTNGTLSSAELDAGLVTLKVTRVD